MVARLPAATFGLAAGLGGWPGDVGPEPPVLPNALRVSELRVEGLDSGGEGLGVGGGLGGLGRPQRLGRLARGPPGGPPAFLSDGTPIELSELGGGEGLGAGAPATSQAFQNPPQPVSPPAPPRFGLDLPSGGPDAPDAIAPSGLPPGPNGPGPPPNPGVPPIQGPPAPLPPGPPILTPPPTILPPDTGAPPPTGPGPVGPTPAPPNLILPPPSGGGGGGDGGGGGGSPTPEPSSWAAMLLGLAIAGAALRRHASRAAGPVSPASGPRRRADGPRRGGARPRPARA